MPDLNFTGALVNLRRQKAAVSGRQPSRNEVAGVIEARANTAQDRLYRSGQLKLAGEELGQRKFESQENIRMAGEQLGQRKFESEEQSRIADETLGQRKLEMEENIRLKEQEFEQRKFESEEERQRAYSKLSADNYFKRENVRLAEQELEQRRYETEQQILVARQANEAEEDASFFETVVGAGVSLITGGLSHLCTISDQTSPHAEGEKLSLARFKVFTESHHPKALKYYLEKGPELVEAMDEQAINKLHETLVAPVVSLVRMTQYSMAYEHYRKYTLDLVLKYLPDQFQEWSEALTTTE